MADATNHMVTTPSSEQSTLDPLYAKSPGTVPVQSTGVLAQAKEASATTQQVPKENLASSQLNDITGQNSPLMARARQEGILTAAKRGLQNSSIAAGAAEGAMVDKATPLAQQNAAQLQEQSLTNQKSTNDASNLNAQLGTQTSQFNAETSARANEQNAAAENQMRTNVMQANSDLNKQFLAGTQAMDLATIQGRYQQLISSNEVASNLYKSYFDSISQAMANKDIAPDRIAQYVKVQQSMLESGLRMMDEMNATDLSNFTLPAVTSAGTGANATITPTTGGTTGGTTGTPSTSTPLPVTINGKTYPPGSRQVGSYRGLPIIVGPDGKAVTGS